MKAVFKFARYILVIIFTCIIIILYDRGDKGEKGTVIKNFYIESDREEIKSEKVAEEYTNEEERQFEESDIKCNASNKYDSFLNFPYENMEYVDDTAFEYIREIYSGIDFESRFEEYDISNHNFYIDKYRDLLVGKIPFVDINTKEEVYWSENKAMLIYDGEKYTYDVDDYLYAFFDMDLDEMPELCVLNDVKSAPTITNICIFKYDKEMEKMYLWREENVCYYYIFGSGKMGWDWQGGVRRGFYQLDEDGKDEMVIFFVEDDYNGVPIYMVTLPKYLNNSALEDLPEEVEEQLYYDSGSRLYYFNVTEKQYDELIAEFLEQSERARKGFEEITVTYDELFDVNE